MQKIVQGKNYSVRMFLDNQLNLFNLKVYDHSVKIL